MGSRESERPLSTIADVARELSATGRIVEDAPARLC